MPGVAIHADGSVFVGLGPRPSGATVPLHARLRLDRPPARRVDSPPSQDIGSCPVQRKTAARGRMRLYQSTIIVPGFLAAFMSYGSSDAVGAEVLAPISRPSIAAARIETANAPTIDGDLSDLAWAQATVIDEFLQVEPDTGAPATERTVLRIMS